MTTKTKKTTSTKKTAAESTTPVARTRPGKKAGAAQDTPTTVTTDGNVTIVEVPTATVTTIDGTPPSPDKASNTRTTGKPKPEPKAKPTKPAASGSLSQLDAAVQVLTKSKGPMNTKQMVDAMAAQGLWSSPGGKTPHATLYSAILRELQAKGDGARFLKVERGHFSLRK